MLWLLLLTANHRASAPPLLPVSRDSVSSGTAVSGDGHFYLKKAETHLISWCIPMSTRKTSPKGQGKNKKERLAEKSMSFHGRMAEDMVVKLIRPRTVPNLVTGRFAVTTETMPRPKLTKLLLNVTVQRSLGPVHVLISPESTVGDLIATALRQYSKEGRRPILPSLDPYGFDLHYSQFSLESLAPEETLNELGSRNFFLCPKQTSNVAGSSGGNGEIGVGYGGITTSTPPSSSCSKEADKVTKGGAGWLRFMEFML